MFVLGLINAFHNSLKERMIAVDFHFQIIDPNYRMDDYEYLATNINNNMDSLVAMPFFEGYGMLIGDFDKIPVVVRGVPDFFINFIPVLKIKSGEWNINGYNVVIGNGLADRFGIKVGDIINIYIKTTTEYEVESPIMLKRLKVSGIFVTGYDNLDDLFIFTGFSTAQSIYDSRNKASGIGVFMKNRDMKEYKNKLNILKEYIKNVSYYKVNDWEKLNSNILFSFKWEKTIMTVVLVIIIIACLFSVYVGYNVVISDKKIDLGILGVLGLDSLKIKKIFILKGILMGFIGIFLGLSLSGFMLNNIYFIIQGILNALSLLGIKILSAKIYYTASLGLNWDFFDIFIISLFNMFIVIFAVFLPIKKIEKSTISEIIRNK